MHVYKENIQISINIMRIQEIEIRSKTGERKTNQLIEKISYKPL